MLKKSTLLFCSVFLMLIGLNDYGYACHKSKPHGPHTCTPPPDPPPDPPPPDGDGGGAQDKYSVKFTFDDVACDTTTEDRDHFCSDGLGTYSDTDENINEMGGKWAVGLILQSVTPRRFFLDFSDNCVDPSCGLVPVLQVGAKGLTSGGGGEQVFSIGKPGFSLLDIAEGETRDRFVLIEFYDTNNHSWSLSFNPDLCDSDLVSVTRINADTWEFVSDDGIACLERAKKGNKGPQILQGRYEVQFGFTVERLP